MNREELLKNAKPILFNTEMVQAILEGRKTVTRRVIKSPCEVHDNEGLIWVTKPRNYPDEYCRFVPYDPYKIGDILYVRETFCENRGKYYYLADSKCGGKRGELDCPTNIERHATCELCEDYEAWIRWRPSLHMPKEAARIFLKVTDVRVERLQDITEEQAIKEGVKDPYDYQEPWFYDRPSMQKLEYSRAAFAGLWFSTIPKYYEDYMTWEGNPWVWVIEFERVVAE